MKITFPKLYRYDRKREHAYVAIPFPKGELFRENSVQIWDENRILPTQSRVTSYYEDGSIRYLFVRFMADLPANRKKMLEMKIGEEKTQDVQAIRIKRLESGFAVDGGVSFTVKDCAESIFESLEAGKKKYTARQFVGPVLVDGNDCHYQTKLGTWELEEEGSLVTILSCMESA